MDTENNVLDTLTNVENSFTQLKMVGEDGAGLAKLTKRTLENMQMICTMFEKGQASQEWSQNFSVFAGDEGQQLAFEIYTEFKTLLTKLEMN